MSIRIATGQTLPLYVVVSDRQNTYVVRASVIRRNPYTVLHSDVVLPNIPGTSGEYSNSTLVMPDLPFVDVNYSVYQANGTTLVSVASEIFENADAGAATADQADAIILRLHEIADGNTGTFNAETDSLAKIAHTQRQLEGFEGSGS